MFHLFLYFDSHGPRDAGGPRPTGRYIDKKTCDTRALMRDGVMPDVNNQATVSTTPYDCVGDWPTARQATGPWGRPRRERCETSDTTIAA